jgi:glutathione synthase
VGDTTLVLIGEALQRGARVFVFEPRHLSWQSGTITAQAQSVEALTLEAPRGSHVTLGESVKLDLRADVDVVLIRQDPPFDMTYLTTTWILERLEPDTRVVNSPQAIRDYPEKLFATRFGDFIVPTLITRDIAEAQAFKAAHGDIVVKPLHLAGGAGVFHLRPDDENLGSVFDTLSELRPDPLVVQPYLPAVREGDKRVILIGGKAFGAINRVPAAGDARSNLHVGGRAEPAELDERDREICAAVGPVLKEAGIVLAGLDVIGGKLTEINITSPTGLRELERFSGLSGAHAFWDVVLAG